MSRPLRVLFVDDSVYDCMLLVKELRHGGFDPRYTRVDSGEALSATLNRDTWDLVISEYTTPHLTITSVLEIVRKHDDNLPVIVVSDVTGDEPAVAAMTAGAQDYVLREKLERLVPAVERGLREREDRRARQRKQEESRRTEELLRLLIEASSEILTVVASDGTIRYASPSVERALGYRSDELTGGNVFDWIHADDQSHLRSMLGEVAGAAGTTRSAGFRIRHRDGSWRTLDCTGRNLIDHPAVAGIVLDAHDVTGRQRLEFAKAETLDRTPTDTTVTRMGRVPTSAGPLERPAAGPASEFLGRYRVLQILGEGGMGTVYKAHDPKLDRLVAIKVPRFDVPRTDLTVVVQRFLREARSSAQVRHPNVCPIYDVDEQGGVPFVVMAYVDGQSLAECLRVRSRYTDPAEAVRLIRQVASGLKAVHAHGIVHRDLKPANILLDREGQPLLTDFGIARPEHETQRLTLHGAVLGTPGYMAPEQAASEAGRIGPWTDVYSLGIVLYCMLTGRQPYEGSALTVLLKQLEGPAPTPSGLRHDLDGQLEAVVLKAMARRVEDRYHSAQEFIDALDQWLARSPSRESAPTTFQ